MANNDIALVVEAIEGITYTLEQIRKELNEIKQMMKKPQDCE